MLYSSNVRKKPDAATITQSRSSNKSTFSETFSLVGTQSSEDDRKSNRSQVYQTSIKKLNRIPKPSKSATTTTKSSNNQQNNSTSPLQPFRARLGTKSNENYSINSHQKKKKQDIVTEAEDGDRQQEKLALKLKSTFIDIIHSSPSKQTDDDMVDLIRGQFDAQTVRIRRLERALKEKEDQVIKGDDEETISLLLARYPQSMELYRKQIEEDQFNQQLEACIEQFEVQKQRMIEEHQRNFEMLKLKYRSRFDDIVERMISDPSRLDDEWARRVKKEADDRIEEMRRKYARE